MMQAELCFTGDDAVLRVRGNADPEYRTFLLAFDFDDVTISAEWNRENISSRRGGRVTPIVLTVADRRREIGVDATGSFITNDGRQYSSSGIREGLPEFLLINKPERYLTILRCLYRLPSGLPMPPLGEVRSPEKPYEQDGGGSWGAYMECVWSTAKVGGAIGGGAGFIAGGPWWGGAGLAVGGLAGAMVGSFMCSGVSSSSGGSGCFVGGTLVLMADGTKLPIEQIRPGDRVLSEDPLTGQQTAKVVLRRLDQIADETIALRFKGGGFLETTPRNRFVNTSDGLIRAQYIERSTLLRTIKAGRLTVTGAERKRGQTIVHNLELDNAEILFVGERETRSTTHKE
jgi:hypothetical protein